MKSMAVNVNGFGVFVEDINMGNLNCTQVSDCHIYRRFEALVA
jgi:hypothetical protein